MDEGKLATLFDRKSASWDTIYTGNENWLRRWWDRLTRQNILYRFEFVLQRGAPWTGKRVLDVGSGSGRYGLALAEHGAAEILGLDISAEMIALARRSAEEHGVADRCRFVRADVGEFDDAQGFDTVIAVGFFDYVPQVADTLRRLRALTRGTLFTTFPTLWALRAPFRRLWWARRGWRVRFFTRSGVLRVCEQTGFQPRALIRRGPIYMLEAAPVDR